MPGVSSGTQVTSTAQIGDGVIVDADVNAAAAIAYSKLNLATSIVNADVGAAAAIVDTKLATISTAGKVSGAALTSLSSIPAGAGLIPAANLPAAVPFVISTSCETSARFTQTVGGSGAVSFGTDGMTVAPGATGTSYAQSRFQVTAGNGQLWNKSPIMSCAIQVGSVNISNGTGTFFIGLGSPTITGAAMTLTNRHIGFKLVKTGGVITLYATQGDNTTENASSALTTVVVNDGLQLYMKVNGSTSVDYWYRSEANVAWATVNLTSNMPAVTTGEQYLCAQSTNQATAFVYNFVVTGMAYMQSPA